MLPSPWLDVGANLFSSVGTVGAFAVAMYLLRKEHKREERHDEEARRSQAVKVSAWIEARPNAYGRELAFHVHNASDMPIYEVSLPMPIPTGDGHGQRGRVHRPGPAGADRAAPGPQGVGGVLLLPGAGRDRVPGQQRAALDPRRTGLPHLW